MLHRIRLAIQQNSIGKLSGHVEVDEAFIGGKARNMHKSVLKERVKKFATPHTGRNQNMARLRSWAYSKATPK
jgi:hypothetical protein